MGSTALYCQILTSTMHQIRHPVNHDLHILLNFYINRVVAVYLEVQQKAVPVTSYSGLLSSPPFCANSVSKILERLNLTRLRSTYERIIFLEQLGGSERWTNQQFMVNHPCKSITADWLPDLLRYNKCSHLLSRTNTVVSRKLYIQSKYITALRRDKRFLIVKEICQINLDLRIKRPAESSPINLTRMFIPSPDELWKLAFTP